MRFDDMFDTVIAMETPGPVQLRAKWMQLCDLLGQRGEQMHPEQATQALRVLASLKLKVDRDTRVQSARAIGSRARFAPLVAFFAHDEPIVAREMLSYAQLDDAAWMSMLPTLSPVARNIVRNRAVLSPELRRALASFGAADFVLPPLPSTVSEAGTTDAVLSAAAPTAFQAEPNASTYDQIHDLVQRIESFRARKAERDDESGQLRVYAPGIPADGYRRPPLSAVPNGMALAQFIFDAGSDGLIRSVVGARPGTIIGLSIAEAAYGEEPGTDAYSAGAFRQRSEIVNARLRLDGDPAIRGDWRFSALPTFDSSTGQFLGYQGRARRPQIGESAQLLNGFEPPDASGQYQGQDYGQNDGQDHGQDHGLRQLLHELKTPLNAISGFSQIIEEQIFGPVGRHYRTMAASIQADATHIQTILDNLDAMSQGQTSEHATTGHVPSGRATTRQGTSQSAGQDRANAFSFAETSDVREILLQISKSLHPSTVRRGIDLVIGMADTEIPVPLQQRTAQRIFMRLISGLIDTAVKGETLRANLVISNTVPHRAEFSISLPVRLQGMTRVDLLDPDQTAERNNQDTAILALGFSLRLVQALARDAQGEVVFAPERLVLILPIARALVEISDVHS